MAANLPSANHPDIPPAEGEPQKPDLMGYDSVEALVNAKRSSDAEAKRIVERNQQLESQISQILPLVAERANPATSQDPYAPLTEIGVPADSLRQVIQQEARNLLREELAPVVAAEGARTAMSAQYPEFDKFTPKLNGFLAANPEVNEQFQWALRNASQQPKAAQMAMEWAYLKYADNERRNSGGYVQAQDTDPAPAAIPSGAAQDRSGTQQQSQEQLKRAFEYGQRYGDWRHFAHERLKGIIPDSHFQ